MSTDKVKEFAESITGGVIGQVNAAILEMRDAAAEEAISQFRIMILEEAGGNREYSLKAESYGYGVVWAFNKFAEKLYGKNNALYITSDRMIEVARKELEAQS